MNAATAGGVAWFASMLLSAGVVLTLLPWVLAPSGPLRSVLSTHEARLDRGLRAVRSPWIARHVTWMQVLVTFACAIAWVATRQSWWVLLPAGALVAPEMLLSRARATRTQHVEEQLDTWLLTLANALRAVPSLGEAINSTITLIGGPLGEELQVAMHEVALGSSLRVALDELANRVDSPVVLMAVRTLEVARRTGGDLPATLEQSAASLREMARLQGVVRTKTADSRSQAWVVSAVPAVVLVVLQAVAPDVTEALWSTSRGHTLLAIAALIWVAAVASAVRILRVDI